MEQKVAFLAFNRGMVSRHALARSDVKRLSLSAETMTNWMPRVLGPMSIRPGAQYITSSSSNAAAKYIPFVFSATDKAIVELTEYAMRVLVDDAVITRPSVSTAVTNGTFTQYTTTFTVTIATPGVFTYVGDDNFADGDRVTLTTTGALPTGLTAGTTYYVINLNAGANTFRLSLTSGGAAINTTGTQSGTHTVAAYDYVAGWTDGDEAGCRSAWDTGGDLSLIGASSTYAIRTQQVTVAAPDQNIEHALNIVISRGPVTLRVGSTSGDDDYIRQTSLPEGIHSLAFTPTGDFHIQFRSNLQRTVLVDSCDVASAGAMQITTPWAENDLGLVRHEQSADVVYIGCDDYQQRMLQRRATRSWSIVKYLPEDGPFKIENVGPGTMTPSVLNGIGTLTSSLPVFRTELVGALFAVTSVGQTVQETITAENVFSDSVLVEGVKTGGGRTISITITGLTATGSTVTLQRSFGAEGSWQDVPANTWTSNIAATEYQDTYDNQLVYYRIGVKTGGYSSGTIICTIEYGAGSIRGICRATGYTSRTVMSMEVLKSFGGLTASTIWEEGAWSDLRGWPNVPKLYDGRLWWFGKDQATGSVSDGFLSFDPTVEGDSAPISRSIGRGPVDTIGWALALGRLIVGGQGAEYTCRSSSLDEPLTATNFNIKARGTQGSAQVQAVEVDNSGVFVQRGGIRVYSLDYDPGTFDFNNSHLSAIIPEIGKPNIVRMAVQRQPDTRIHFVRSDGTVAILVFDRVENVTCWCEYETDGTVEDVVVLPGEAGDDEDFVYYHINRTINGNAVRYLEKWAFQDDCMGATTTKLADSFATFTNSPASATVTGLTHLVGESVVVWADGKCLTDADGEIETFVVNGSGQIILTNGGTTYAATTGVAGLPYTAQWKSGKLVQINTQTGTGIKNSKNIKGLGLILADTHHKGLQFGRDFTRLDDLPSIEDGTTVDDDTVTTDYDGDAIVFPGTWGTDERLCLQAKAPRPATVLSAICEVEHHG